MIGIFFIFLIFLAISKAHWLQSEKTENKTISGFVFITSSTIVLYLKKFASGFISK